MPAVGQYGGMTVTPKGRKGLPAEFDHQAILAALWVLECETSCKQGTAFGLPNVGLVTCEHVLGPDTRAFKSISSSQKFTVTVVASNPTVDLAIIKIEGASYFPAQKAVFGRPCNDSGRADPPAGRRRQVVK